MGTCTRSARTTRRCRRTRARTSGRRCPAPATDSRRCCRSSEPKHSIAATTGSASLPTPEGGGGGLMQLTPKEAERRLVFTAAELARRRRAAGIPLSHPDAIALASDTMLERARAGASYEDVRASARGLFSREQLVPG